MCCCLFIWKLMLWRISDWLNYQLLTTCIWLLIILLEIHFHLFSTHSIGNILLLIVLSKKKKKIFLSLFAFKKKRSCMSICDQICENLPHLVIDFVFDYMIYRKWSVFVNLVAYSSKLQRRWHTCKMHVYYTTFPCHSHMLILHYIYYVLIINLQLSQLYVLEYRRRTSWRNT